MKRPGMMKAIKVNKRNVLQSLVLCDSSTLDLTGLFTAQQRRNRYVRVSQLQFFAYYLHTRDGVFSTIHHSGRLFQEWLVDAFAQIENNRIRFHQMNQA